MDTWRRAQITCCALDTPECQQLDWITRVSTVGLDHSQVLLAIPGPLLLHKHSLNRGKRQSDRDSVLGQSCARCHPHATSSLFKPNIPSKQALKQNAIISGEESIPTLGGMDETQHSFLSLSTLHTTQAQEDTSFLPSRQGSTISACPFWPKALVIVNDCCQFPAGFHKVLAQSLSLSSPVGLLS